jgi:hypothetical protein
LPHVADLTERLFAWPIEDIFSDESDAEPIANIGGK